jgi:hypothetical protein
MGNVLSREKREQVIALGRLGWPLRRIEQATGVRRETAGDYLRSAGIVVRSPGTWGPKSLSKPATSVTAGSDDPKPAIEVITGSGDPKPANDSKPATLVTTGFLLGKAAPAPVAKRSAGVSEAYREMIELELSRGRNATGIWQDLVDTHGFTGGYQSVKRFVRKLRGAVSPEARVTKLSTNAHLALAGLAEDESSCVARVVQNAQHPAVLQGAEHQLSCARTLVNTPRPQNAFRLEVMNDTHGGTSPAKGLEQQTHGSLYLLVRVENHPPTVVIDETQRRFHPQIAAPCLVELTANESGTQQVQFGFTHRPFQAQ